MAYTDYEYDVQLNLPANWVVGEEHVLTDRGIFTSHGMFFGEGLVLYGYGVASEEWTELEAEADYVFSPPYPQVSAEAGSMAYSYLVYKGTSLSTYSKVKIDYRVVGQHQDDALLLKVAGLTTAQRSKTYEWGKIQRVYASYGVMRDPQLRNMGLLEAVNNNLGTLATAIIGNRRTGASNYDVVTAELTEAYSSLAAQVQDVLDNGIGSSSGPGIRNPQFTFLSVTGTTISKTWYPEWNAELSDYVVDAIELFTEDGTSLPGDIVVSILRDGVAYISNITFPASTTHSTVEMTEAFTFTMNQAMQCLITYTTGTTIDLHIRVYLSRP